ncbi:hypothetical protein A3A76_00645 [Candidatus Woesebacteria bacterium RIFCSPLOWO2_01_FULL_39_23]|uniref:Uncharacterized protein n=1 Tax=Candidatus Woesebacteria bacterium RIFCSPHIGHO2_01_FULL_40_22 TaxID=1802499 RepID=A0A1F7YIU8_9BACT|nr:MAG: hypothetical protein A2141_05735 [Candidatus Woesebacteria bacterium RBG_16_40_11]OGM27203.1 MAG: hypothetical protein A2628_04165 [Candidatus Woesebacteria bacterium RIFCSPHIGHO2_01_FULL_40_22]OGM63368.1 MAG: hypothetical protein A3A76_00645 [Candidatus Woesebacteria bacterium RIFCSPLOWO2_01_FULL_39_23]
MVEQGNNRSHHLREQVAKKVDIFLQKHPNLIRNVARVGAVITVGGTAIVYGVVESRKVPTALAGKPPDTCEVDPNYTPGLGDEQGGGCPPLKEPKKTGTDQGALNGEKDLATKQATETPKPTNTLSPSSTPEATKTRIVTPTQVESTPVPSTTPVTTEKPKTRKAPKTDISQYPAPGYEAYLPIIENFHNEDINQESLDKFRKVNGGDIFNSNRNSFKAVRRNLR